MRLEHKVAVVTGGQTGIGKAIALRFAREGADVVIPDISFEGAQEVAREIEKMGRKSLAIKMDVSNSTDVGNMVKKTVDVFGRIDILVNNAGIVIRKGLLDHTEEDWNRTLAINLTGPFLCTKAVVPYMKEQKKGKIINMASIAGVVGYSYPSYGATKAGVLNLTRGLVLELAQANININCICPGVVRTPISEELYKTDSTLESRLCKGIPAGRLGKTEDIASAAVFLASDESDYCHGTALVVDGGSISAIKFYE